MIIKNNRIDVVISIDKDAFDRIRNGAMTDGDEVRMGISMLRGKPLPKGHGRLIDADELKKEYPKDEDWDYPVNTNSYVVESIDNSTTIIEADKRERGDKE